MRRLRLLILLLLCIVLRAKAQEFINLTAQEVRIDSVLPVCFYEFPLLGAYADSTYSVSIEYPEFIDMTQSEVRRLQAITSRTLPELPEVDHYVGISRKHATLYASLVPLVQRDGRYQKLVSFKLKVNSYRKAPLSNSSRSTRSPQDGQRYAAHSVLSTGQWAKISVPSTGVYQLTDALVRQAGFSNPSKVKIYGYGGALQPEVLTGEYLASTDDLQEVPTCTVGGRRLFHAVGPVTWSSATATLRTRNPYSTGGCYFITQGEDEPLAQDSATFIGSFYPTNDDYHSLYEVDSYAWYHSGRNLVESTPITADEQKTYKLEAHGSSAQLTVVLTADGQCTATVSVNDSIVGTVSIANGPSSQSMAVQKTATFNLAGSILLEENTIGIRQTGGNAIVRLDYLTLTMPTPAPAPDLKNASFPSPQLLYRITNQDHHADEAADMVIIIPTTQKFVSQAQRLKQLHEKRDSLRVNIVPADELFNEFSSGTPDANAYRRYLKMLYDRAESEADLPRYLLLFGDGAWDNRMLSINWKKYSPDDFLLCYESEESFSETMSYVSDDYFCLLDDGEGGSLVKADKTDVGVGRLTARSEEEATVMVDKIIGYANNDYAGDWQNVLCFMGDDGNGNVHMREAEAAVQTAKAVNPAFNIKKVYWDAYERTVSSVGYRYPDATRLIKQQMQSGALVMDYCGHGAAYTISHERVLNLDDFAEQTSLRLPLWVTASCDIMPYDSHEDNIGETAMLNSRGGAIAFFGTTRTVYTGDNQNINCAFLKYVLGTTDGRRNTLGDAVRLAKNDVRSIGSDPSDRRTEQYPINKLHYTLLGDPALTLAVPTMDITVDGINGQLASDTIHLKAGETVTVTGHVENGEDMDGIVALTVKDIESTIVCRLNNSDSDSDTPFEYQDRPTVLYNGQDSLRQGRFTITFVLPQDISYSDDSGQLIVYARSSDRKQLAHGHNETFTMGSSEEVANDGIGPSIYCYLNTSSFTNGGDVNTTPYFHAELTDKDGINAAGSSLGHDLELIIDGEQSMTYNLNDYFQFTFGDYRSGSVGYSLPKLSEGQHHLLFRAWDVLNNSSVAEMTFNVVRGLTPHCFSVECTRNPATTFTTFIINHDRTGSEMDIVLEVFDASGRLLWRKSETGISTDSTYALDWDLTTSSGSRLQTGVYLYRVLISTDGSRKASQAEKLIILNKH